MIDFMNLSDVVFLLIASVQVLSVTHVGPQIAINIQDTSVPPFPSLP